MAKLAIVKADVQDQLEELKEALGQAEKTERVLNLSRLMSRLLLILMKREVVSQDTAYVALYYDVLPQDRPNESTVHVWLSYLRKWLTDRDIKLRRKHEGWYLVGHDKQRIQRMMDSGDHGIQPSVFKYPIEKGVPLQRIADINTKYPFIDMEVGDSFFVKGSRIGRMTGAISYWRKTHPDIRDKYKFTARKVDGGVRVWRIK